MNAKIALVAAAMLVSFAGEANAKATFACLAEVEVGGYKRPTEAQAKASARARWVDGVRTRYGASWASLSRAQDQHYTCRAFFYCEFAAKPCGPVAPQDLSPHRNNIRIQSVFN